MNIKDQLNMQAMYDRQAKGGIGPDPAQSSNEHEPSIAELREAIKRLSGKVPGPRTGRERLIELLEELQPEGVTNDA